MPRHRDAELAPPTRLETHDGLAYALFEPDDAPRGGVVILHGAGSTKESHFDFARRCRAAGLAAVAFDQRGHGQSAGELGIGVLRDVEAMAGLLPPGPLLLRGSSMGAFVALAVARRMSACGVVAVCPASAEGLLRGLRRQELGFRADRPVLDDLLCTIDLQAAARALGPRLLLMHAEGDEQVPVEHSARLHAVAPGSRLIRVPGGHHRSVQHDPELQALSVAFLRERAGEAGRS